MKIPGKSHNHEAQPSQGTKGRRDEEQIGTPQTQQMKAQTYKQRGTATEGPPWNGQQENYGGRVGWGWGGGLNKSYLRETLRLNLGRPFSFE